jgi:hypothetical protein
MDKTSQEGQGPPRTVEPMIMMMMMIMMMIIQIIHLKSSGVKNPRFMTPEDGIDRVSRNVGKKLRLLAA